METNLTTAEAARQYVYRIILRDMKNIIHSNRINKMRLQIPLDRTIFSMLSALSD